MLITGAMTRHQRGRARERDHLHEDAGGHSKEDDLWGTQPGMTTVSDAEGTRRPQAMDDTTTDQGDLTGRQHRVHHVTKTRFGHARGQTCHMMATGGSCRYLHDESPLERGFYSPNEKERTEADLAILVLQENCMYDEGWISPDALAIGE